MRISAFTRPYNTAEKIVGAMDQGFVPKMSNLVEIDAIGPLFKSSSMDESPLWKFSSENELE